MLNGIRTLRTVLDAVLWRKWFEGRYGAPKRVVWTMWYRNGAKAASYGVLDPMRDGPSVEWYSNGTKRLEALYARAERRGEWRYWDEDGRLSKTETYESDQLTKTVVPGS